jgi:hypothetical protein
MRSLHYRSMGGRSLEVRRRLGVAAEGVGEKVIWLESPMVVSVGTRQEPIRILRVCEGRLRHKVRLMRSFSL